MKNEKDFLESMWNKIEEATYLQAQERSFKISVIIKVLIFAVTLFVIVYIFSFANFFGSDSAYIIAALLLTAAYFIDNYNNTDREGKNELSNYY